MTAQPRRPRRRSSAPPSLSGVRCAAVALHDGTPLVVVSLELERLGGVAKVARAVFDAWGGEGTLPPMDDDSTVPLEVSGEVVRVASYPLPVSGRLVSALLVVGRADVGAVPEIVRAVDLRGAE